MMVNWRWQMNYAWLMLITYCTWLTGFRPADAFVLDGCRTSVTNKFCGLLSPWAILGMELPQSKRCWDLPHEEIHRGAAWKSLGPSLDPTGPHLFLWRLFVTSTLTTKEIEVHFLLFLLAATTNNGGTCIGKHEKIGIGTTMQPIDGWINSRMDVYIVCVYVCGSLGNHHSNTLPYC